MRRLLIFLAILLVIVVGGDFLIRAWAERRAAEHVAAKLDLEQDPSVSLGGWPFLFSALDGTFPNVVIDTGPVTARGVRLDDVRLELRDVSVSLGDAIGGGGDSVTTRGGRGEATIGAEQLSEGFRSQGVPAAVMFRDGTVLVDSPTLQGVVEGGMALRGRRLVLSADGAPTDFTAALPPVVEGLSYEDVRVEGDRAVLIFSVEPGRLSAP